MSNSMLPIELPFATLCNASIGRVAPHILIWGLPTHWQQSVKSGAASRKKSEIATLQSLRDVVTTLGLSGIPNIHMAMSHTAFASANESPSRSQS
jgi:hypothetical protein